MNTPSPLLPNVDPRLDIDNPSIKQLLLSQERVVAYMVNELTQWQKKQDETLEALHALKQEMSIIKVRLEGFDPSGAVEQRIKIEQLDKARTDIEARVRALESKQNSFSGKWGVIAAVATAVFAALLSLAVKLTPAASLPAPQHPNPISQPHTP